MHKKFMKHAKKLTNSEVAKSRPVLTGVNHFVSGDLAATNSHVLYYGKNIHAMDLTEDKVITPAGKTIQDKYPNVERLIPSLDPTFKLTLNVAEFWKATDIVYLPGKVSGKDPVMVFETNTLTSTVDDVSAKYTLSVEIPEDYTFASNAGYWFQALQMFRDFGYKEVEFNFNGNMRPFTLVSPDDKLMALILPIRRY